MDVKKGMIATGRIVVYPSEKLRTRTSATTMMNKNVKVELRAIWSVYLTGGYPFDIVQSVASTCCIFKLQLQ